jgi:hypothetical protein
MGNLLGRRPRGRSRKRKEGYVAAVGRIRNAYKVLFETPQRTKPLGRLSYRCEDNEGF